MNGAIEAAIATASATALYTEHFTLYQYNKLFGP